MATQPATRPKEVPYWIPLAVLLVPAALLALGSLLFPEAVYRDIVRRYYWDPIRFDEGYNVVNTASWAVLLGALMFVWYRILTDLGEPMDVRLALAAVPYIAFGSIVRVLEDTRMFGEPLRFFFITPQNYVLITLLATGMLLHGLHLRRLARRVGTGAATNELLAWFGVATLAYALLWARDWGQVHVYANPLVLGGAFLVAWYWVRRWSAYTGRVSPRVVMGAWGAALLVFFAWYVALWFDGPRWNPGLRGPTHAWVLVALVLAPLALVLALRQAALRLAPRYPKALVFAAPFNLLLVFAQMGDAMMTTLGVDVYGYSEKHVLPRFLIAALQDQGVAYAAAAVMLPFKLLISLGVIWAIDVYAKQDAKQYPNLVGVAKMAIVIVGLAPGIRDGVRLAMGV